MDTTFAAVFCDGCTDPVSTDSRRSIELTPSMVRAVASLVADTALAVLASNLPLFRAVMLSLVLSGRAFAKRAAVEPTG